MMFQAMPFKRLARSTDTILGAIRPGDTGDLFRLSLATGMLTLTATRIAGVLGMFALRRATS